MLTVSFQPFFFHLDYLEQSNRRREFERDAHRDHYERFQQCYDLNSCLFKVRYNDMTATASGGVTLTAITSIGISFSAGAATQIAVNAGQWSISHGRTAVSTPPSVIVEMLIIIR